MLQPVELELQILDILNSSLFVDVKNLVANIILAAKNAEGNVAWVTLKPEYHSQLVRGALSLLHLHGIKTRVVHIKNPLFSFLLQILNGNPPQREFFDSKKLKQNSVDHIGQHGVHMHSRKERMMDPVKTRRTAAQPPPSPTLAKPKPATPPPQTPSPSPPPPTPPPPTSPSPLPPPIIPTLPAATPNISSQNEDSEPEPSVLMCPEHYGATHPCCEDCLRPATGLKYHQYPKCEVHRWRYNGTYSYGYKDYDCRCAEEYR